MMKHLLLSSLLLLMALPVLGNDLIGIWKTNIPVTMDRMDASPEIKSRVKASLEDLGELEIKFTSDLLIATRDGVTSTASYYVKDKRDNCYGLGVEGGTEGISVYVVYCVEGDLMYISVNEFREYYSRQ